MRAGAELTRSLCTGEAQSPCPRPLRKYVLAVAVLGSSLGFIDGTIITVAMQPIRDGLDATFAELQWVVNAYTLALAAFLLVGGAAGDRYGKRRIFGIGIVIFAAASVVCGFAPTVETLIAARVVQGLGAALMVPGSLALIAVNFPAAERGRAVGLWAAASGVTSALGPLLGGLLIDLGSWRLVFYVNVPVAALALALLYLRVPADAPQGGRFDVPGAVLAFLAVGAFALGATLAESAGLTAPSPILLVAAGVAIGALFVAWQKRAATPMLPLDLFASRTFAIANTSTLLLYFALGGVLFFLPITLMEAHGWTASAAGAIFLPFTAAMAIVSPLAGRLADRIGHRALLVTGPLVTAGAFAALASAVESGSYASGVAPVMAAFGIGMGLAIPSLSAAILGDAGDARAGIASGVNNAVARLASLLAVSLLGLVASLLYRSALGLADHGFAAPADVPADLRTTAILDTFATLSTISAVLCLAAALLAIRLPSLGAPSLAKARR